MADTTLSGGISNTIEERLSGGIQESLPKLDPIFKYIQNTWVGVSRDGIGRDWKVIHTFVEGVSGAFKWVTMAGDALNQDTLTHGFIPGNPRSYPGLEDTTLPRTFQKHVTLVEGHGNLFAPQQFLRASKLEASIGSYVLEITKGASTLNALADITAWYNTNANASVLATVGNNPAAGASAECHIKGAVGLFYDGMHVDIYRSGTKINTSAPLVVDGVGRLPTSSQTGYGAVTLKTKDGSSIDIAAGDLIVWADSYGIGPIGPSQWLANTGTVFGINLATYPQEQSLVVTNVGDLDEAKLNQYFSRLWKAYGAMNFPDTVQTSMGVTTALLDSSYGLPLRFNRDMGDRNVLTMGFDAPGESAYTFNGIPIRWLVSPYMPSDSVMSGTTNGGRLWAMKLRDKNVVRYVPPPLPGARRSPQFGAEVEFPFAGNGPDGIFIPYLNTTARPTQWYQAPYNRHCIYMPKYLPGMNLSGITETL